jgi:hypothetical protein
VARPTLGPTPLPVQRVPGVLSLGLNRVWCVTLTTHPHLVPRSRMSRSYTPSSPCASVACRGTALAYNYTMIPKQLGKYKITQRDYDCEHKGGGSGRRPLHRIFWSIVHSQLLSIPPVGPYPIRSKLSCTTEYYHGRLVPRNFYLSDYVLIQQSPHTHIRHVRPFRLGCYLKPPLHAHGSVLPRLSFWASSWYFQTSWSSPDEACLP